MPLWTLCINTTVFVATPNRTESNNVLDDAKLLELSELMGLGGNADFDRIKTAAVRYF